MCGGGAMGVIVFHLLYKKRHLSTSHLPRMCRTANTSRTQTYLKILNMPNVVGSYRDTRLCQSHTFRRVHTCTAPWGVRRVPVLACVPRLHSLSMVKENSGYLFRCGQTIEIRRVVRDNEDRSNARDEEVLSSQGENVQ